MYCLTHHTAAVWKTEYQFLRYITNKLGYKNKTLKEFTSLTILKSISVYDTMLAGNIFNV